jgi:hypothetical protein
MDMRRLGLRALAAIVALGLGGLASAQDDPPHSAAPQIGPDTGRRGAPAPAPAAAAAPASMAEVTAAAACMISHDATAGDALLATAPHSAAERAQAVRLLPEMRRCTHGARIVSSPEMMRGAFAEAAAETVFATPPAPRTPPLEAAPLPRPTEVPADYLAQVAPMYQLVDCATPRQPALVRAVLATDPGSPAEGSAVAALYPTFQACVPPGTTLRIDHRIMRLLFGEALYRWSMVQRDGPTSPWAAAAAPAAAH